MALVGERFLSFQLSLPNSTDSADLPLLRFGMIGFDRVQRQQIEGTAQILPHATTNWRAGAVANADAWLVCGDKTRAINSSTNGGNENLRVLAGLPSERAVTLSLQHIDRPLAFSLPLNNPNMEPRFTFELGSPHSIQTVLQQFERCLWLMHSQYMLGKYLVERELELKAAIYHVMYKDKLLAVMDFVSWRIGMLTDTDPQHFKNALWKKRPEEARDIPSNFLSTTVAELRWVYALHSTRYVLPARYRHELMYFRKSPQVPLSWLSDSHLLLLQVLSKRPVTFQNLIESTGLPDEQLARDLACLYFAGSLTTKPSKTAKANAEKNLQEKGSVRSGVKNLVNIFNSTSPDDDDFLLDQDTTVSARLRPG